MTQSQHTEEEKVSSEKKVDVLFGEELEEYVEGEKGARCKQGEHQRIFIRHGLMLFTRLLEQYKNNINKTAAANKIADLLILQSLYKIVLCRSVWFQITVSPLTRRPPLTFSTPFCSIYCCRPRTIDIF